MQPRVEEQLRKCVIEAVKKVRLPKPNKPGLIAFGSEALFKGARVRALCD
jgi:hypothetical protein